MKTETNRMRLFAAALALLLAACAAGGIRKNPDVDLAFRNLTVPPTASYWYLNLENEPYAVVGLEGGWRIEDKMWHPVTFGTPTFQKVVGLVEGFPVPGGRTSGSTLVDPQGNPIGIWFSSMIPGVQVNPETKLVTITTGTPWMQSGGNNGGRE